MSGLQALHGDLAGTGCGWAEHRRTRSLWSLSFARRVELPIPTKQMLSLTRDCHIKRSWCIDSWNTSDAGCFISLGIRLVTWAYYTFGINPYCSYMHVFNSSSMHLQRSLWCPWMVAGCESGCCIVFLNIAHRAYTHTEIDEKRGMPFLGSLFAAKSLHRST